MRYRIDPDANTVSRTRLYDGAMEMPRVARSVVGRRHRYAYGQATDRAGANGLVKVDCETGTARSGGSGRSTSRNQFPSSIPMPTPKMRESYSRRRWIPSVSGRCS